MPPGPARIPQRIRRQEGASDGAFDGLTRGSGRAVRNLAVVAVLAIGGLGLGWAVLKNGVADALAGVDPAAALRWRSDHAGALSLASEQALNRGDPTAAAGLARQALEADPLDVRAIRVMGLAAERTGDPKLAEKLLADAGARSRRDGPTQIWLFSRYAATGDYDQAFARADALLRDRPEMAQRFYPVMNELAARPEAAKALAARLKIMPPWRDGFMQSLIRVSDPARSYALLESLEAAGAPATAVERKAMLNRLIQARAYQPAFVFWVQGLDKQQLESLADLRNGEFAPQKDQGPFSWTIEPPARNFVDFVDAPDRDGGSLNIVLSGGPAPTGFVRQLLVLGPGPHRLTGEVKAEAFNAIAGPAWQIRCAEGNTVLAETEPLTASTGGWRTFSAEFVVPEAGCEAQWLRLRLPGRDRRMSGEIWYDRMAISR
jgi:tetratricopeptide (TPR) repeat protein